VLSPPFAYLAGASTLDWLDLCLAAAGALLLYVVLVLIRPAASRPLLWLLARAIYRLRVFGPENIPLSGPVLLVSNHVSYIDWLLIWVACPRPVRFVAWAGWKKNPLLRFFLYIVDAIPIDGQAGPKAILAALERIRAALDRGDAVCLFPEGQLTRTGAMLPFHRGFEKLLQPANATVPVIPVYLSQVWGSIFSYRGGRLFWKWPQRFPYPAALMFGQPLPSSITAPDVRQSIQELSAETAIRDSDRRLAVHRQFVRLAARWRQLFRPCFIDTSAGKPRTLTYAKALVGAILIARWLRPRIGDDRNVGVWLPSSVGGALANLALPLLGRTSVNLNYTAGIEAVRSAAKQTGMKTVVTSKRFLARMPLDLGPEIALVALEEAAPAIGRWRRLGTFLSVLLLPGWLLDRRLGLYRHALDDIATIIFSSGSTGEPKGVMLSHRNIACNTESMVSHIDIGRHDRILGVLPFFHSFGYTVTFWIPLVIGGSAVYHADPRQAREVGELCRAHRCTALLSTATFLRFYMRRCELDDFRSLRILICGAEKLPVGLAREFEAKFGVQPGEGYGCTELSPVVAANVADQDVAGVKQTGNKFGAVGCPLPGVAIRTMDAADLQPLPFGQEGLVLVKGANVMVGYLGKPEMTAAAVRDGWYNTGDMGRLDDDGFLTITGRLSRFAKIAGEMVPLEKIEEDLHAVLGSADRMLAVSSVPDERRGERLIVLFLPTLTAPIPELLAKLGAHGLPNLWLPSPRDFYPIDEMPVLGSGKLDLRRVKALALERAGPTPS
jgi:acyl-[acyl-carrier-protein]-phospholipid O-acyltransferase / long-chain-fatty-acid--[acyl-carrier-protein] ligase